MEASEPQGVGQVRELFGDRFPEDHRLIIDEIHPDLPEDWDVHQGVVGILEALLGKRGRTQQEIAEMGVQLLALLLTKNTRYGDSALRPLRIFARDLVALDQIHVRMDDKLSRLARGADQTDGESPVFDLAGYMILELVAQWEARQGGQR